MPNLTQRLIEVKHSLAALIERCPHGVYRWRTASNGLLHMLPPLDQYLIHRVDPDRPPMRIFEVEDDVHCRRHDDGEPDHMGPGSRGLDAELPDQDKPAGGAGKSIS
jgi:hypothetical protein